MLFGGYEQGVRQNDLLQYRFQEFKWTNLDPMGRKPQARAGHSALIKGSKLIICAGTNDENLRLNDTWVYEFMSNQWS